jgi:hypothetical protein
MPAEGIGSLRAGRFSVKRCLHGEAAIREQLKPLLKTISAIGQPWNAEFSSGFELRARSELWSVS